MTNSIVYATGPLIVAGERVHRRRAERVEPVVTADCVVEADGLHEHVFEVRVLDVAANEWVYVEVIHDFRSWDANDTVPCDPIVYGRRLGEPSARFDSVEAAFDTLLPGVPVPAIDCNYAVPSVRDTPACDIKPGMRIQVGAAGIWQPPVSSVKTYGPGKDENPSHPHTWWTRLTLQCADGSHTTRVFSPSTPVRVVEGVGCRECKRLVPVADAVLGRRLDHSVMPPRFVEQYDLCPNCAETGV